MKHLLNLCIAICISTTVHAMELEHPTTKERKKACKETYKQWTNGSKTEAQKNFPLNKTQLQFLVEYAIKKKDDDFLSALIRVRRPIIDTTRTDKLVKKLHTPHRQNIRKTLESHTKIQSSLSDQNNTQERQTFSNYIANQPSPTNQSPIKDNQKINKEIERLKADNTRLSQENIQLQRDLAISISLSEVSSRSTQTETSSESTPRDNPTRKPENKPTAKQESSSDSQDASSEDDCRFCTTS